MKLVELLATKLDKWADTTVCYVQDSDGSVWPCTEKPNYQGGSWVGSGSFIDQTEKAEMLYLDISDDNCTAIVTRAKWQAERDRQKGGEWKRHRGGKCPVKAGTQVSTKHRDGKVVEVHHHTAQTGSSVASLNGVWKHNGDSFDIMSYRVISQPQAEEPAVNVFVGKDVNIEYAFSQDGVALENLDWKPLGNAVMGDVEFDSMKAEEVEVKDTTIGTLSYKVEIDTTEATQAIDELAAKWDQVDGPLRWRDCVNELDAYIEEFTREREALINRLALEGFALIPAMTPAMGVADELPTFRDWMVGDIVEVISTENFADAGLRVGDQMPIVDTDSRDGTVKVVSGSWGDEDNYKFIRRP